MVTPEEAHRIADQYATRTGSAWFDREVEERSSYWVFRVGSIGSIGIVVDKADGVVTVLGSAFSMEDWLWGYERGLLVEKPTLRILAVHELRAALELLLYLPVGGPSRTPNPNLRRSWLEGRLARLPCDFRCEGTLGLALPDFRRLEEVRWFDYEIVGSDEG